CARPELSPKEAPMRHKTHPICRPSRSPRQFNRAANNLGLESLESRINLSAMLGTGLASAHGGARDKVAGDLVASLHTQSPSLVMGNADLLPSAGATAIGGVTTIPVGSYSAIFNSQLETIPGQSSPNIGYVSTSGSYVEYTITAPAAGSY